MFKLIVTVPVQNEKAAAFEEMVKPLVENSRKEEGNISCDIYPDVLHPNCYIILETWKSDDALEAHNQTPHYLAFAESINEYLDGTLTLHRIEPQENGDFPGLSPEEC